MSSQCNIITVLLLLDADMLSKKAQQGGYQEAADRLMDIEGLPKKS